MTSSSRTELRTGAQLRAARALAKLDKEELYALSGVSPNTIRRLEEDDGPLQARKSTIIALESVLTAHHVEFWNDDAPGARLRLPTAT
jgi:hypothetical protein